MMECNHRVKSADDALREMERLLKTAEPEAVSNVPCNGCTLCCQGDAIRILPEDDATMYQTVPHDHFKGELMLAHKPNGDCVYLELGGCSIQATKPLMCKEMDCRRVARMVKKRDLKRLNVPHRVWAKGRQLAGKFI